MRFTLIFQVKSMPMQHMLTLHMFLRSPHTSPCPNRQRLQRWDDDHDGTITINTTDEEGSISQSSCFCVFQCMSYCSRCVPYARLCTQQRHFFLNRKWSESNSHTEYACTEPNVTPRDQICRSRFTPDLLLVWLFFTCVHWEQCLARGVLHRGIHKSGVFSTVSWAIRVPIVAVGAPNLSALHCTGYIRACPAVGSVNRKIYIIFGFRVYTLTYADKANAIPG